MVVVNVKVGEEALALYMDGQLHEQLTKSVVPAVQKKDFDYVFVIDGPEGSGKSVLGFQIAKILDPNFNLNNICFTPQEFIKVVTTSKPHSCIVFDEAFTGLSSRSSLSEMNQLLVTLMMEMRQRNLFIILIMPSFFMLDKYAVLHRAKGLFHVYLRNGKRGYWNFYNQSRMKKLYIEGKRYYEYYSQRPRIFGVFRNQYTINEEAYREKKGSALKGKKRKTRAEAYKEQRDISLWIMYKELGLTQTNIAKTCGKWGFKIAQNTISEIIAQKNKELLTDNENI